MVHKCQLKHSMSLILSSTNNKEKCTYRTVEWGELGQLGQKFGKAGFWGEVHTFPGMTVHWERS